MVTFKRFVTLALTLVLVLGVCLPALSDSAAAADFSHVKGSALVKSDGSWYYVRDGQICNVTTLVKYNNEWWYVVNGKVASDTTSLVKWGGEWWYIVKGKVASKTTTLVKYNNEWWYVVKGKIASKTTTLVKYNNEWWYVVKGKIAAKTTGMVKYNNEWWYVIKGKVASKTTTLVKHNGDWYYIVKGKLASQSSQMVKYNGGLYYVHYGKVDPHANLLVNYNTRHYLVLDGKVDTTAKTKRTLSRVSYTHSKDTGRLEYTHVTNYDWSTGYSNYSEYSGIYSYDAMGRVSNVKYWSGGYIIAEEDYTHYDDGRYDINYADKQTTSQARYNSDGQLICSETTTEAYLQITNETYNEQGDLTFERVEVFGRSENVYACVDYTFEYTYNDQNTPVSRRNYVNGVLDSITYYTYRPDGELTQTLTCYEADEVWEATFHTDWGGSNIYTVETYMVY